MKVCLTSTICYSFMYCLSLVGIKDLSSLKDTPCRNGSEVYKDGSHRYAPVPYRDIGRTGQGYI